MTGPAVWPLPTGHQAGDPHFPADADQIATNVNALKLNADEALPQALAAAAAAEAARDAAVEITGIDSTDTAVAALFDGSVPGSQTLAAAEAAISRKPTKYLKRTFGAVGDGATDDTAAFEAAFNPATPHSLIMEPGTYLVHPNLIVWDVFKCVVESAVGVTVKVMNTAATDVGFRIMTSQDPINGSKAKRQPTNAFEIVCGNGSRTGVAVTYAANTDGNSYASGTVITKPVPGPTGKASSITTRNLVINGFQKAVVFGDEAYMLHFDNCAFENCDQAWVMAPDAVDAGERISAGGGTLFGDQVTPYGHGAGVYANPMPYLEINNPASGNADGTGFFFHDCSFDWIAQLFLVGTNARMMFNECWFESPSDLMLDGNEIAAHPGLAYGVQADHSVVVISQSRILLAAGTPAATIPYLFNVNGWSNTIIRDCHAYVLNVNAWANLYIDIENLIYEKDTVASMPIRATQSDGVSLVDFSWSCQTLAQGSGASDSAPAPFQNRWMFDQVAGNGSIDSGNRPPGFAAGNNSIELVSGDLISTAGGFWWAGNQVVNSVTCDALPRAISSGTRIAMVFVDGTEQIEWFTVNGDHVAGSTTINLVPQRATYGFRAPGAGGGGGIGASILIPTAEVHSRLFRPARYVIMDGWIKATGTATSIDWWAGVEKGNEPIAAAFGTMAISTAWTHFRQIIDVRHNATQNRLLGTSAYWKFARINGDKAARLGGLVFDVL